MSRIQRAMSRIQRAMSRIQRGMSRPQERVGADACGVAIRVRDLQREGADACGGGGWRWGVALFGSRICHRNLFEPHGGLAGIAEHSMPHRVET